MTKKQEMLIKGLADGMSDKEACEYAGMNEKSIYRLKKDANFNTMLTICCVGRLKGLLPKAIDKLEEIVENDDPSYYPQQIQAIKMVLEYSHLEALIDDGENDIKVTVKYE